MAGIEIWIPVVVTILGAFGSSYMGVKLAIVKLDGRITANEKDIARHEKDIEKIQEKVFV